jgi:hypothetical protein
MTLTRPMNIAMKGIFKRIGQSVRTPRSRVSEKRFPFVFFYHEFYLKGSPREYKGLKAIPHPRSRGI